MTEHPPIQRWTKIFTRYPASELLPNENGEYVTYADHLAALRACEERVIAAAVQRVDALPHSLECVTRDANYSRPCNCLHGDALDAIKGDQP